MKRTTVALICALAFASFLAAVARADIYQWQWVNPADHSQGKQPGTTCCPGGAGVSAAPGADLDSRNLTQGYLIGANLTGTDLNSDTLSNADLTNAIVQGANFGYANGFTAAQLYSTASYAGGNLAGIVLDGDDLTGWNFSGQTITNASFVDTSLTTAQLYSTASYKAGNLTGINLSSDNFSTWNFAGQNLTSAVLGSTILSSTNLAGANLTGANLSSAVFSYASLTGATLTGANVRYANFNNTTASGFTAAQLYSTAGYQAKDLTGINLAYDNLSGWNFCGQTLNYANFTSATLSGANLAGASLTSATIASASLTGANLAGANLTSATMSKANLSGANLAGAALRYASLANATLDGADARGATYLSLTGAASTQNLINADGSINGMNLSGAKTLVVRNYTASSIPIKVHTGMSMGTNGILDMVLDGNAWGSTISFDTGIPVALGGTLDVTLASGVNPATLLAKPVKLFNWTGVTPTGNFTWQDDQAATGYVWDTSELYATGAVTLYLPGDTNRDGAINSLDIDAIYQNLTVAPSSYLGTWPRSLVAYSSQYDVNGDGVVSQDDVTYELNHYFHTNYGDANLDKATDFGDFQTLLNHWQASGPGVGWATADFNGDGVVDFLDFQILLNYWNPGGWNFAPSQTPEPASLSLILLGALALLRRSRKG
jgi:uncharacterized protein YjbI with pentapeptide repeats